MIGRWLALLTEQEEDNLLTTKLIPFAAHFNQDDMGCLVGVALKHNQWGMPAQFEGYHNSRLCLWLWWNNVYRPLLSEKNVAYRFNELCQKLVGIPVRKRVSSWCASGTPAELEGGARAARLIRARILRHRAQRALAGATVPTPQNAELVEVA